MDSDNVSESVDDWEVLEFVGIDDNGSIGSFLVKCWVNNFKGADESIRVDFVCKSGINNDSIEVAWFTGSEGGFGELNVLVLYENGLEG